MSDRTTSVPTTQSQTETPNHNPELTAVPSAEPQQTAPVQQEPASATAPIAGDEAAQQAAEQSQQAAAAAEQAEEAAREEAAGILKATVRAYRHGERAYRNGLLDAGRLADLYVHQRLALGDKRAAAVQTLEGALAAYSSTAVDANRLVSCYHAYRLLAEEPGLTTPSAKGKPAPADTVPYGHYRDAWCRLVERQHKDTAQECWTLLPGLDGECRAAFAKAVADGLSKAAVDELVRGLVQRQAERQAEAARAEAEKAKAEAAARAAERAQATADLVVAEKAKAAAEEAARKAAGDEQALLKAAAEQAARELLAKQRAAVAAGAAAEQAAREQARKEAEAKTAADARAKAEQKAAAKAAKAAAKDAAPKPATVAESGKPGEPRPVLHNLLQTAKAGTAKDVASMAAELVTGSEAPDDVLAELLGMLAASEELSSRAKRACQSALVVLTRKESPSPVQVAAALQPATAAAANGALTAGAA
jgi:hypothetical protein